MGQETAAKNSSDKSRTKSILGVAAFVAVAVGLGFWLAPKISGKSGRARVEVASQDMRGGRGLAARADHGGASDGLIKRVDEAWSRVQDKVDSMSKALEENERLQLENANLRLRVEGLQFDCRAREAARHARDSEWKLSKTTGSLVGRTLASIQYRPPTNVLPSQLHTLAVSYLRGGEDEKAAVIFTQLAEMDETQDYKTPRNYLLAGVAWYRIDNFELAGEYFDKVLRSPDTADALPYQAQARLWRALVAKRTGKSAQTQQWLRELLDHHPHSTEAKWVNTGSKEVRGARHLAEE
jgi:tetratricopeptide (TPR) repeat protein